MKTLALQILCCLSIGILGLHAATAFLAPVQVSQTGYFSDAKGNDYLVTTTGAITTVTKVVITSNAEATIVKRKFLVSLVGTPKQAEQYLISEGATQ